MIGCEAEAYARSAIIKTISLLTYYNIYIHIRQIFEDIFINAR